MIAGITKFLAPVTVVGAPVVATAGLLVWKLGTIDEREGLDVWLRQSIKAGGGHVGDGALWSLKNSFGGNIDKWSHVGFFVETVGDYMKRILVKEAEEKKIGVQFDIKNTKKIVEKVGFEKDQGSGDFKLALAINDKEWNKGVDGLCVISVAQKNMPVSLNFLVGFYSNDWQDKNPVKKEEGDQIVSGYNSWCAGRAKKFSEEGNLAIGIHLNRHNVTVRQTLKGEKVTGIDYWVSDKAAAFVGKDTKNRSGWSRTCASKDLVHCDGKNYPIVLGVIGQKQFKIGDNIFEEIAVAEKFSKVYWGRGENLIQSETPLKKSYIQSKSSVPVGVTFENVDITGKTLKDWIKSPE